MKLDRIIELLEIMNKVEKKPEKKRILKETKKQEEEGTEWSVENYKNSILISFSYNIEFKGFIKEIGGKWLLAKKSWMFPGTSVEEVVSKVSEKYPEWVFTDKR